MKKLLVVLAVTALLLSSATLNANDEKRLLGNFAFTYTQACGSDHRGAQGFLMFNGDGTGSWNGIVSNSNIHATFPASGSPDCEFVYSTGDNRSFDISFDNSCEISVILSSSGSTIIRKVEGVSIRGYGDASFSNLVIADTDTNIEILRDGEGNFTSERTCFRSGSAVRLIK